MQAAWNRLAATFPAPRADVGALLIRRYQSRGRHYHTLTHVAAMLRLCDRYASELRQPDEVRVAIWFHDAVYSSRRDDNEERSAGLALRETARMGRPSQDAAAMILATKRHRLDGVPRRLRHDTAWLLDFDLAILASDSKTYDAYASAIRREYRWVLADAYTEGRAKVLRTFLARRRLFHTPDLRAQWETAARENLRRELTRLAGN